MDQSPEYARRLHDLQEISVSFLSGLRFIAMDSSRLGEEWENHLLSHAYHDMLETVFGILSLAGNGISNIAKRELRFMLEIAVKVCFVEQKFGNLTLNEKIAAATELLNDTNIGIKKEIQFDLLSEHLRQEFRTEVGRLYGAASNWVHLTVDQIKDRIDRGNRGITAGKEGLQELESLIAQLERCYAATLVLLLHSVPRFIAGDFLVDSDGISHEWYFERSRFIANIDEGFDYKAERTPILNQVKARRLQIVRF